MVIHKRGAGGSLKYLIIIGTLLIAIAVLLVIVLYEGTEEITDSGHISFSAEYKAIIVRDENAVTTQPYDKADYIALEGEYVNAGDPVVDIYKRGYNDELMLALQNMREQVYAAQLEQLGETKDSNLEALNDSIAQLEKSISNKIMLSSGDRTVAELERELEELLQQRMEYLKGVVQETETLRTLYAQEQECNGVVNAWKTQMNAETSGTVSFYFDDYENAVNADTLGMLTADLINGVIKGKDANEWMVRSENFAYRIVDNTHWYCAFVTKSSDPLRVSKGYKYQIDTNGYGIFEATALEPQINGNSIVNILEINEDIGELINIRSITLSVAYDATGIKVQKDAIKLIDHIPSVALMYGDGRRDVPVDVLTMDDKYAIIKSRNESEQIVAGVRYWIP